MSYILDALKKAEEERRKGEVPGLEVLHEPAPVTGRRGHAFLLVLAAVSAAVAASLLFTKLDQDAPEIPAPPRPRAAEAVTAMRFSRPAVPTADTTAADNPTVAPQAQAPEPSPPPAAPAETALPELSALPETMRAALPEITISAHFYSDDPGSRMASVNGRIVHEGDQAAGGLTVRRITPDGVIFEASGRLFTVPVR